ncbi:MAG TPA: hypothetical protein VEY95_02615 [Azospirillaceae bacterium]|nr:hypothetical protein [Azospirillaceae bacterium]
MPRQSRYRAKLPDRYTFLRGISALGVVLIAVAGCRPPVPLTRASDESSIFAQAYRDYRMMRESGDIAPDQDTVEYAEFIIGKRFKTYFDDIVNAGAKRADAIDVLVKNGAACKILSVSDGAFSCIGAPMVYVTFPLGGGIIGRSRVQILVEQLSPGCQLGTPQMMVSGRAKYIAENVGFGPDVISQESLEHAGEAYQSLMELRRRCA